MSYAVVDDPVSLLDDLADVELPESHVFSTRAERLVSGYVKCLSVVDVPRDPLNFLFETQLRHHLLSKHCLPHCATTLSVPLPKASF